MASAVSATVDVVGLRAVPAKVTTGGVAMEQPLPAVAIATALGTAFKLKVAPDPNPASPVDPVVDFCATAVKSAISVYAPSEPVFTVKVAAMSLCTAIAVVGFKPVPAKTAVDCAVQPEPAVTATEIGTSVMSTFNASLPPALAPEVTIAALPKVPTAVKAPSEPAFTVRVATGPVAPPPVILATTNFAAVPTG
jgi:hypothetical protein